MKPILILVILCGSAMAQTRAAPSANEIRIQQKWALVIGNAGYVAYGSLKNPPNDAAAVARTLRNIGFDEVFEKHDLNYRQMRQEVDRFVARINKGDLAWVYYAGHGVQANERNYLIPIDFSGGEADLDYEAYPADQLRDKLEKSGARLRVIVLDACRNNPFRSSKRDGTRGLVHMDSAVEGTYIAFATADNSVAADNPNESNGLFTKYLLSAISTPGLDLKQVFERTKEAVYAASDHNQRPYTYDGVIGQYFFNGPVTIVGKNPRADPSSQEDIAFWNGVDKGDAQSLELYLRRYPDGRFASLARRNLEQLRASAVEPRQHVDTKRAESSKTLAQFNGNAIFQPEGHASTQIMIVVTPNAGNATYTGSILGTISATLVNGTFSDQGSTLIFKSLQSSARSSFALDGKRYSISAAELSIKLSPGSSSTANRAMGTISGSLRLTGNPISKIGQPSGSPAETVTGQIIGSFSESFIEATDVSVPTNLINPASTTVTPPAPPLQSQNLNSRAVPHAGQFVCSGVRLFSSDPKAPRVILPLYFPVKIGRIREGHDGLEIQLETDSTWYSLGNIQPKDACP
jgi:Caspase domain